MPRSTEELDELLKREIHETHRAMIQMDELHKQYQIAALKGAHTQCDRVRQNAHTLLDKQLDHCNVLILLINELEDAKALKRSDS